MPDFDLIIIGGGIIGGSVLYHLAQLGYPGRVLVLEREDALSKGSTALSAGGFRNIWTTPINMRLTSYSIKKLAALSATSCDFPIGFDQRGYLFCQYEENFESAKTYGAEWAKNGVRIEFLDAARSRERKCPGLRAGIDHIDPEVNEILQMKPIAGGVFGPDCGSFDPSAAAQGYFERGLEGFDGRAELRLRTRGEEAAHRRRQVSRRRDGGRHVHREREDRRRRRRVDESAARRSRDSPATICRRSSRSIGCSSSPTCRRSKASSASR